MAVTAAPGCLVEARWRSGRGVGREALGPAEACARGERPESPAGFGA